MKFLANFHSLETTFYIYLKILFSVPWRLHEFVFLTVYMMVSVSLHSLNAMSTPKAWSTHTGSLLIDIDLDSWLLLLCKGAIYFIINF